MDFAELAERFEQESGAYRRLTEVVSGVASNALLDAGVPHMISKRSKEFASFFRKMLKKGYDDPFQQTHDLAAVRVMVPFLDLAPRAADVIRSRFTVLKEEDKAAAYDPDRLGYLGRHLEVSLREQDLVGDRADLRGRIAEVQVHTRAQAAWADAEHDLVYKPLVDPPKPVRRRIVRLTALVELFDDEMARARSAILALPGAGSRQMLAVLETLFLPLARSDYDRELSLLVLDLVRPSYQEVELERFEPLLREFVLIQREKLAAIFRDYAKDPRRNPLLFQPEALAVFERATSAPVALRRLWDKGLPPELLDSFGDIWGVALAHPLEE